MKEIPEETAEIEAIFERERQPNHRLPDVVEEVVERTDIAQLKNTASEANGHEQ